MDGRNMDPTAEEQYSPISMPNLRNFASNGVQFIRHYTNGPQCVCGRSVLWSGRRTNNIHVYNNNMGFAASSNGTLDEFCIEAYDKDKCQRTANMQKLNYTILDAMESMGYDVYIYGKLHIGAGIMQMPSQSNATSAAFGVATNTNSMASITRSANIFKPSQGNPMTMYDDNAANPHSADENIVSKCIERLNNLASSLKEEQTSPFMLYCSVNIPHPSYQTNATWLKGVNVNNITIPSNLNVSAFNDFDQYTSQSMDCLDSVWTNEQILNFRKTYYGLNVQTDYLMGKVINASIANGFNLSNTYFVFTSDHGEDNLDHRQYGKNSMYEGAARIPLFVAGPNINSNIFVTNFTETVDVLPTLLSLAGTDNNDIPSFLDGTSLIPFLREDEIGYRAHPNFITSQYHSLKANTGLFMVRKDQWKYIQYGHYLTDFKGYKAQLFDLKNDKEEMYDVSGENENILSEMEGILRQRYDYEYVDCVAKTTDFEIFEEFVWNKYNQSEIKTYFEKTYKGFNETDWEKVINWRNELLNSASCEDLSKIVK